MGRYGPEVEGSSSGNSARIFSIELDHARFRKIVRGRVRENLKKYMTRERMVGRQGDDLVSIPVPEIELPRFRFGSSQGGAGQGEGEPGTPLGPGQPQDGGRGGAGDQPGQHMHEVELEAWELDQMLADEFKLRRLRPKKKGTVTNKTIRVSGHQRERSFRRDDRITFRRATKVWGMLNAARGLEYDGERFAREVGPLMGDPRIIEWKSTRIVETPSEEILVVMVLDVSGSVGGEMKEWMREFAWLMKRALELNYKKQVKIRWVVHEAVAKEVDEETALSITEAGGTKVSSGYEKALDIFKEFSPDEKDMFLFHFTDGDNLDGADNKKSLEFMEAILDYVRLFGVGWLCPKDWNGESKPETSFIKAMRNAERKQEILENRGEVVNADIESADGVWDALLEFGGEREEDEES